MAPPNKKEKKRANWLSNLWGNNIYPQSTEIYSDGTTKEIYRDETHRKLSNDHRNISDAYEGIMRGGSDYINKTNNYYGTTKKKQKSMEKKKKWDKWWEGVSGKIKSYRKES